MHADLGSVNTTALGRSNPCDFMALKEPNFRFALQSATIVTWSELHFYDLPLIRPSGFVKQWAAALGEAGGMTIIGCYPIFCLPYRIGMLSRSRKRDLKALKIEIVQRKQLA
jgi:hypothetical protein